VGHPAIGAGMGVRKRVGVEDLRVLFPGTHTQSLAPASSRIFPPPRCPNIINLEDDRLPMQNVFQDILIGAYYPSPN
jgi:hypothetical protein